MVLFILSDHLGMRNSKMGASCAHNWPQTLLWDTSRTKLGFTTHRRPSNSETVFLQANQLWRRLKSVCQLSKFWRQFCGIQVVYSTSITFKRDEQSMANIMSTYLTASKMIWGSGDRIWSRTKWAVTMAKFK